MGEIENSSNIIDSNTLSKLDEISACVSSLTQAQDDNEHKKYLQVADNLLKKYQEQDSVTTINVTSVNNGIVNGSGSDTSDLSAHFNGGIDQDAFLREIERDANERAERRAANRKRAAIWKDKGNDYFKVGDFQSAIDCYTKGIGISKDFEVLYQNRANCYIKIGKFEDALKDSEDAVFLTQEKSSKPFFHMARALAGLYRFEEAKDCYQKMGDCVDGNKSMASSKIVELEQSKAAIDDEKRVMAGFDATVRNNTLDILVRLARNDQPLLYYTGGLRFLADSFVSLDDRILFRNKSGFNLIAKHSVISTCLQKSLVNMKSDDLELLQSVFYLCAHVCLDNLENCKRIVLIDSILNRLLDVLTTSVNNYNLVLSAINLCKKLSEDVSICKLLCDKIDLSLSELFLLKFIQTNNTLALPSAELLEQLFVCPKHLNQLFQKLTASFYQSVEKLISVNSGNLRAQATAINCFVRLCLKPQFRLKLASQKNIVSTIVETIDKYVKLDSILSDAMVTSLLGLATSLSFEVTTAITNVSKQLAELCLSVLKNDHSPMHRERALGLLSNLVPRDDSCAELACKCEELSAILSKVITGRSDNPSMVSALRILAAGLKKDHSLRITVGDSPVWLDALTALLHSPSQSTVGNTALCISATLEDTMAAEYLSQTEIVKILLVIMRESKGDAQANCAILCGKLAQCHHGHREMLRKLDGINILTKLMENNKFY